MSEIILANTTEQQEIAAMRAEAEALATRIAALEPQLVTTRMAMRDFETRYLNVIGLRYQELADIEKQINQLQGLEWDEFDPLDGVSLGEDEVGCGQNRFHNDKLKKLYREVARKYHPDLAEDDHSRVHCTQLMIEANRAYEAGAEKALESMLAAGRLDEQLISGSPEFVWLTKRVADLRAQEFQLSSEWAELTDSELYRLRLRVEKADEIGVDLLSDLVQQVDRQIRKARNRLEALQGVMMTA